MSNSGPPLKRSKTTTTAPRSASQSGSAPPATTSRSSALKQSKLSFGGFQGTLPNFFSASQSTSTELASGSRQGSQNSSGKVNRRDDASNEASIRTNAKLQASRPIVVDDDSDIAEDDPIDLIEMASSDPAPLPHDVKGKGKATEPSKQYDPFEIMWSSAYPPETRSELSVHKKKVEDVEKWLREALDGPSQIRRYRRLLCLSGPSGCGKSSLMNVLRRSDELDFEVVGFENRATTSQPTDQGGFSDTTGLTEKFAEFLLYATNSRPLALGQDSSSSAGAGPSQPNGHRAKAVRFDVAESSSSSTQIKQRKVIVVDEVPNMSHSATKEAFQAALESILVKRLPQSADGKLQNVPVVIIISESTARANEESWTSGAGDGTVGWKERLAGTHDARTILTDHIRSHPAFAEIKFLPVNMTLLKAGLNRIADLVFKGSGTSTEPPTKKAKKLPIPDDGSLLSVCKHLSDDLARSSDGDIRSAVNALQMAVRLYVATDTGEADRSPTKGKAAKGKSPKRSSKADAARLKAYVAERESSLALWHAVGKVLYNKREGEEKDEQDRQLVRDLRAKIQLEGQVGPFGQADQVHPSQHAIFEAKLPRHLRFLDRKLSLVNVETLWSTVSVELSSFQLFLHHNLLQFCDEVDECAEILHAYSYSDADLQPRHEGWLNSALSTYYQFLTSTRATLLYLPSPVPRRRQKLTKPHVWDVGKRTRQHADGLLEAQGYFGRRATALNGDVGFSTASSASMDTFATEIIPILAKMASAGEMARRQADIPEHLAELGTLPWRSSSGLNGEDDGSDLENTDAEQYGDTTMDEQVVAGAPAMRTRDLLDASEDAQERSLDELMSAVAALGDVQQRQQELSDDEIEDF